MNCISDEAMNGQLVARKVINKAHIIRFTLDSAKAGVTDQSTQTYQTWFKVAEQSSSFLQRVSCH